MSEHGYDTGRLNLPFVGISTFGKRPICEDWDLRRELEEALEEVRALMLRQQQ